MNRRKIEAWAVFNGNLLLAAAQHKEAPILRLGTLDTDRYDNAVSRAQKSGKK